MDDKMNDVIDEVQKRQIKENKLTSLLDSKSF
jgi:stalled ribosome alternative rescue factor ArfA